MNWLNRLRPAKGATAAELFAKLAEAEQQAATLAGRVADLERQRGPLLLDGTPAEVKAAEAALAAAREELAALSVVAATLAARAANAGRAERVGALQAESAQLEAEASAIAVALHDEYPAIAARLAAMFRREFECADRVVALTRRLDAARLEGLELPADLSVILPRRRIAGMIDDAGFAGHYDGNVGESALLPGLSRGDRPYWQTPSGLISERVKERGV